MNLSLNLKKIPSIHKVHLFFDTAMFYTEHFIFESLSSVVVEMVGNGSGEVCDPDLALEQNSKVLPRRTRKMYNNNKEANS